ncbi:MAG: hypothetical protein RL088_1647 [Verrucomicrobiota bacterium]|jgi:predicted nuclease of restriction endonuclease-like (RecB) superfamily
MPRKPAKRSPQTRVAAKSVKPTFAVLVESIQRVHDHCSADVNRVVNVSLTLRNWVIGAYIAEYEINGADRAKYGEGLLDALAAKLVRKGVTTTGRRQLYQYLTFYRTYPQIVRTVSAQSSETLPKALRDRPENIVRTVSAQFAIASEGKVSSASPTSAKSLQKHSKYEDEKPLGVPVDRLIQGLSYSHIELLIAIDAPLKRAFYEIECLRGNWSVRALKRQIATLYFERSGLSKNKEKLASMVKSGVEVAEPKLTIRDPYIFEFLGLRAGDAMDESELESALLDHLQSFLLELGHGFCLEARQKSILIGRTRGFVDLVFYHRLLKCHVLVELKVDEFSHEHLGQLNTYVTWYRKHMMAKGDNPPVGLLLCTDKDHALVEYAMAGMDSALFVSKYELGLPKRDALRRFLEAKLQELGE